MKCCFIDLVIEQVNQGNRVENTFNQQAWTHMITAFNGKFGLQCDKQFLEDQYFCIMKQYEDISSLLNHDGFAWDETLQMVIAENDVWEAYIKVCSFSSSLVYFGCSSQSCVLQSVDV